MKPTKKAEAAGIRREHLVRILSEQVERTFSTEGQTAGLRMVAEALGRLDDDALRELAYLHGLTTEAELEPEETDLRK